MPKTDRGQPNRSNSEEGNQIEEAETVTVIRQVAAGDLSRDELTEWLRANSTPISKE